MKLRTTLAQLGRKFALSGLTLAQAQALELRGRESLTLTKPEIDVESCYDCSSEQLREQRTKRKRKQVWAEWGVGEGPEDIIRNIIVATLNPENYFSRL